MEQQIKSKNKNNKTQKDSHSIKIAFQANIFKYVEKKKREFSLFQTLNKNRNNMNDSVCSNLIYRNTLPNFRQLQSFSEEDSRMFSTVRIKLAERKVSHQLSSLKKKVKGHKSSLSDWRDLYDERDNLVQKNSIKQNFPEKMAVTDRLFYPAKDRCSKVQSANNGGIELATISEFLRDKSLDKLRKDKQYFVSDQNFIHMYHRSNTPAIGNEVEGRKIKKYLKQNKDRKQLNRGLRRMNEGIFNNTMGTDVHFLPYNLQNHTINYQSQLYKNQTNEENPSTSKPKNSFRCQKQTKFQQNNVSPKNQNQINTFKNSEMIETQGMLNSMSSEGENPENIESLKSKFRGEKSPKSPVNLADLCTQMKVSNPQNMGIGKQIRLKLFKPRRNKIEKAIFQARNTKSEFKFANFQYSLGQTEAQKTCSNWKTNRK